MKTPCVTLTSIAFVTLITLASAAEQTPQKTVSAPSEESALAAACDPKGFGVFTNSVTQLLRGASDRKGLASRYLFDLLNDCFHYLSPQLEALKFLRSQGADVNYEAKTVTTGFGFTTVLENAVGRHSLEFVQWLVQEGADVNHISEREKLTPLEVAVVTGEEKVIRWLLEHGAIVQEQKTGRSLLATALVRENPDALIPLLLKAGADPYVRHAGRKSAVDFLAENHDVMRLRRLDTKGVYRQLLAQYTPAKDSPFIGIWKNEESGFETFSLILNHEGLAIVGASIMPFGFFPWRTEGTNRAVIEMMIEKGKRQDIVVELQDRTQLRVVSPEGMGGGHPLKKRPEKPLSVEEYRKALNSDEK